MDEMPWNHHNLLKHIGGCIERRRISTVHARDFPRVSQVQNSKRLIILQRKLVYSARARTHTYTHFYNIFININNPYYVNKIRTNHNFLTRLRLSLPILSISATPRSSTSTPIMNAWQIEVKILPAFTENLFNYSYVSSWKINMRLVTYLVVMCILFVHI